MPPTGCGRHASSARGKRSSRSSPPCSRATTAPSGTSTACGAPPGALAERSASFARWFDPGATDPDQFPPRADFGAYLADWPESDIVGLWDDIAKKFSQLGGNSAPMFLRMAGKDTFILTPDVIRALNETEAFSGTPKGKRDKATVQEAFNAWATETDRPLSHLSMILAASAG